jgi:hypothetical protein
VVDKWDTETTGEGLVDPGLMFESRVFVINRLKLDSNLFAIFALFAQSHFDSLEGGLAERDIDTVFISTWSL